MKRIAPQVNTYCTFCLYAGVEKVNRTEADGSKY